MIRFAFTLFAASTLLAQVPGITLPPSGDNQRASVSQGIGPVQVTIDYSSPAVKNRRGAIWGKLVPYGLNDFRFGTSKQAPWRGGANENTVFAVSHPVKINGQRLAAGRYGLHFIVDAAEWTLILSKNSSSWGSFFYDPAEDALRVKIKPTSHAFREWLTYEFTSREPAQATVEMQWEDLAVAWQIEVDDIDDLYISRLREDLRSTGGFGFQGFLNAALYTLQIKKHYEQGLEWAEAAISRPFVGQANFTTLAAKARLLGRLGRDADAQAALKVAMAHPTASVQSIHGYARQLQATGDEPAALEIFRMNHEKHGDVWPATVGLMRYWSAKGDYAKALEAAKKALPQADDFNRPNVEKSIQLLSEGKPIA